MELAQSEGPHSGSSVDLSQGKTPRPLIHNPADTYGASFSTDLLEQYKLLVQSAENVSARRVASSRYLLTLNAALAALYGFQTVELGQSWWALLIPIIGLPASAIWFLIIKSHADLNRIKFEVIHELEEYLPAAIYQREWELAGQRQGKGYRAVTSLERWTPILFAFLHIGLIVSVVVLNFGAS